MKHQRRKPLERPRNIAPFICPTSRKVSWDGKRAAKVQAKHLGQLHRKVFTPYLCPECNYWHLTSQRQAKDTTS